MIDRVEQIGGSVVLDVKRDGKTIVEIDLGITSADDDELKVLEPLKQLRRLNLWRTDLRAQYSPRRASAPCS